MQTPTATTLSAASCAALALALLTVPATAGEAVPDSALALSGEAENSVLESLTIEGENRIQFDFERPELAIDLDPAQAPGLIWGDAQDVLDRTQPDLFQPLLALSEHGLSPYRPQPWREGFRVGPVARFRPRAEGVVQWELAVVDARGEVVREFEGEKNPPEAILWDGRDQDGQPAIPGLTYSYVFTARDRAGNRKRFVGEGFEVPPFRLDTEAGPVLVLPGDELGADGASRPTPLVQEAASWLNRRLDLEAAVVVVAMAASVDQAEELGGRLREQLLALIPGDPARVLMRVEVAPGLPAAGSLRVEPAPERADAAS